MDFRVELDVSLCITMQEEIYNIYYTDDKYDILYIEKESIVVSGMRSKRKSIDTFLYTNNSIVMNHILKSLVYVYAKYRMKIKINSINVSIDGDCEKYTEIRQIFGQTELSKSIDNIEKIFDKSVENESMFNFILIYLNAINEDNKDTKFSKLWRSFNFVYRYLYNGTEKHPTEQLYLRNMRIYFQNNESKLNIILNELDKHSSDEIRSLRLREFILSTFPIGSNDLPKQYNDFCRRFSDYRICKTLLEVRKYRSNEIISIMGKPYYESLKDYLIVKIKEEHKSNIELLCFYVLKYSYFLRCKYFHAEKIMTDIYLLDNYEINEIAFINRIIEKLMLDIIIIEINKI